MCLFFITILIWGKSYKLKKERNRMYSSSNIEVEYSVIMRWLSLTLPEDFGITYTESIEMHYIN